MHEINKPSVHKTVLVQEVLAYLDPQPDKVYVDVTFGGGGHTRAILQHEPRCKVIGIDWDAQSLETYGPSMQEEFGDRFSYIWGNFGHIYRLLKKVGIKKVDGILADFGTSQIQIIERAGFSIYRDTPLDMRMSAGHQRTTAEYVVNKEPEEKLADIFFHYGEERQAKKIARLIVQERKLKKITTTKQLAELIERILPKHPGIKIHPATKVFQALRIYVNRELDNIISFLAAAPTLITPGGRLVCISFHSLEDRLVKQTFKEYEDLGKAKVLTKKVVAATQEEVQRNPSSRSAKLRAIQVL